MPVWQCKAGSGELWVEAPLASARKTLCVCRCEPRRGEAERAGVISLCAWRACKRMQQTDIHASILLWIPAGTDVLFVTRNNIFFAAIRLKTFNYACSRQPLTGIWTAADRLRAGSSDVCITLLGRIQGCNPIVTRLRHFNSTLSPLVGAVSAYKTADYSGNPINGLY